MVILDYINNKAPNAHYYFNKAFLEINNIKDSDTIILHQEYFKLQNKEECLSLINSPEIKIFKKKNKSTRLRNFLNIIELLKLKDQEFIFLAYDMLNLAIFIILSRLSLKAPKIQVIVHNNAKDLNSKFRLIIYKIFFGKVQFLTLDKSTYKSLKFRLNSQIKNIGFYYSKPKSLIKIKESYNLIQSSYICIPSRRNVDEYFLSLLLSNTKFKNYLISNNITLLSFFPLLNNNNKLIKIIPKGLTEEEYYSILIGSKQNIYIFNKDFSNRNSVSIIESYLLDIPYCILKHKNQFDHIEENEIFFSNIDELIRILEKGNEKKVVRPFSQLNKIFIE